MTNDMLIIIKLSSFGLCQRLNVSIWLTWSPQLLYEH
jgi:hypothetical protein